MANEFFAAYGADAAISLTPGSHGRIEVYVDGEKIFDKKEEGNVFPNLARVHKMKEDIKARLESVEAHAD